MTALGHLLWSLLVPGFWNGVSSSRYHISRSMPLPMVSLMDSRFSPSSMHRRSLAGELSLHFCTVFALELITKLPQMGSWMGGRSHRPVQHYDHHGILMLNRRSRLLATRRPRHHWRKSHTAHVNNVRRPLRLLLRLQHLTHTYMRGTTVPNTGIWQILCYSLYNRRRRKSDWTAHCRRCSQRYGRRVLGSHRLLWHVLCFCICCIRGGEGAEVWVESDGEVVGRLGIFWAGHIDFIDFWHCIILLFTLISVV